MLSNVRLITTALICDSNKPVTAESRAQIVRSVAEPVKALTAGLTLLVWEQVLQEMKHGCAAARSLLLQDDYNALLLCPELYHVS